MWFDRPPGRPDWAEAERHLRRADPALGDIIERVGPCTLAPRRDYFVVLCKAIFTQQISTAVATTLFGRFRDLFPMRRPTPGLVLRLFERDDEATAALLRNCGLSRQKRSYILDLARHFQDGRIPTRRLSGMGDEEVINALVGVHGVGRWTAELFLLFVLNRADVLPVGDLGLRDGVRAVYGLPERPTAAVVTARAEVWRPFRSIATWYMWRRLDIPATPSPTIALPERRGVSRDRRKRNKRNSDVGFSKPPI